jgi:hypothetical protein
MQLWLCYKGLIVNFISSWLLTYYMSRIWNLICYFEGGGIRIFQTDDINLFSLINLRESLQIVSSSGWETERAGNRHEQSRSCDENAERVQCAYRSHLTDLCCHLSEKTENILCSWMYQLWLGDRSQLLEASVENRDEKLLKSIDTYVELRFRATEHQRSERMNDMLHPVH